MKMIDQINCVPDAQTDLSVHMMICTSNTESDQTRVVISTNQVIFYICISFNVAFAGPSTK